MDFLQLTIEKLESERIVLLCDRQYNEFQIERCDRLIEYYCMLYNNILETINSKRDSLDNYQMIVAVKEKLRSPSWLERFSMISDSHLNYVIEHLNEVIESLSEESEDLKDRVHDFQKEKRDFEQDNDELDQRLEMIEMSIENSVLDNSKKQKVIRRG